MTFTCSLLEKGPSEQMAERLVATLPPESRSEDEALSKVFIPESIKGGLTPEEEARFNEIRDHYDEVAVQEVAYAPAETSDHEPRATVLNPVASVAVASATAPTIPTTVHTTPAAPTIPPAPVPPSPTPPLMGAPGGGAEMKLVLVDQSKDARDFARDKADARLTEELQEGGRIRRFVKGIWKGNLAKDYYRQKYIREAQTEIQQHQDVLVHETDDAAARIDAKMATIERFQSEYEEMRSGKLEKREVLAGDNELAQGFKRIIREFAAGNLDEEALAEERGRVIQAYTEAYGTQSLGEGLVRTDNLIEIAKAVKGAVAHGESLDTIVANMQVVTGEARTGARTEAHYSKADKAVEFLSKRKATALLPESAIAVATAVASGVLRLGSSKAVVAALTPFAAGAGAGVMAAVRERKRVKDERQQHAREMAMGKQFNEGDRRRAQMETTRYETVSAVSLIEGLRESHATILQDDSERTPGQTKDDALQAALDALAAVELRNRMSDTERVDLISYTDVASANAERMELALARAELKVALGGELDASTRARLGLEATASINDLLDERATSYERVVTEDMSAKDKAFSKLRTKRVAFAAVAGFAVGETLGLASQEALASVDSSRAGLVERAWDGKNHPHEGVTHQTLLEGLLHDSDTQTHVGPSSEYVTTNVGEHGSLQLSADHTLVKNEDGTFNLVDAEGRATVEDLRVEDDGSLSPEAIGMLEQKGMTVENMTTTVDVARQEEQAFTFDQFMDRHRSETTHIHRTDWLGNGTPEMADLNEQQLRWGENGGVRTDGGFTMSVATMTSEGSFGETGSVDWAQSAENGTLKLAVSPSVGEQAHPILVDINPDGSIDIPVGNTAARFFEEQDGQVVFKGGYAEVVHLGDTDAEGRTGVQVLATEVGTNEAETQTYTETVTTHTPEVHPSYKITTDGYERMVTPTFTEMPPVIPVTSRRSMEAARSRESGRRGAERGPYAAGYYGGGREISIEDALQLRAERSPRLNDNPEASLRLGDELDFYHDLLLTKRGQAYLDSLNGDISTSPELSHLPAGVESIITIPVAAASEADNIYKTLSLYAQQDPENVRKNLVYLHVNWIDDMNADPVKLAQIERTRQEIARARADFPTLHIATTETEYEREEVKNGIIGHVSRRMVDTALMSLRAGIQKGGVAPDRDVLVVRNDADMNGIGRHYVKQMQETARANEQIDVFTGTTRFGIERYHDLPGFGVVTNIMQMGQTLNAGTRYNAVHLGGANAAVRASTLAAVGGLGFSEYTGAGVDDVALGSRIATARSGSVKDALDNPRLPYLSGYNIKVVHNRRVLKRVRGATIDTNGDRLEALYRQGDNVVDAWDDYDTNGGYKERGASLSGNESENVRKNFKDVAERVRQNIERIIEVQADDTLSRSVLALSFPDKSHYKFVRNREGKVEFSFTRKGKSWLRNQMLRDSAGRPDAYGAKAMRRLYGVVSPVNGKRPIPRESPLVRPQ